MAPAVERLKEEDSPQRYFCVNLASQEEFDANLFDKQFKELIEDPYMSLLKYIVIDNKMFLFPIKRSHLDFYLSITKDPNHRLQSAGQVTLSGENGLVTRVIGHYAESLEPILPIEVSDQYRLNEIKPTLGQFFIFPDL